MTRFILLIAAFFSITTYAQTKYSLLNVSSELTKNANSVLIDQKIIVDVSVSGKLNFKMHSVRIILNEAGDSHLSARINYDKATKIKKLEAYIYDSFGEELKHYKKKDFVDVSAADGYSIFSDNRVVYLSYTPTTYPYILEFTSEIENNTTLAIPNWYPVNGYAKSTTKSEYILKFDPLNKPRFKTDNLEGFDIAIEENPNEIICTASNIPAFKYERLSPLHSKILPNTSFALNNFTLVGVSGAAKNWEEFGLWMERSILNGVDDIPEATVIEIKNLIKDESTNEAKARIVYNYLQETVRYISVQIGIGGWRPMLASEVDKLSYGDCKALSNYTKTLLDAVGIPSYYTILYSSEMEQSFDKNFSRLQGNHVILGVPDGDKITWLECTSQRVPFGYIGGNNDDRDVLIITPDGGKIAHTKVYPYHENLQDSKINIKINKDGSANTSFNSVSQGLQYGNRFSLKDLDEEDIHEQYKNRWDNINGFNIEEYNLIDNRDSISFTEELKIYIPNYCSKIGNDYLCSVNVFNKSSYVPKRIEDRKNKLHISTEFEDVDVVEITIPDGYGLNELPENKNVESDFGSYSITFKKLSENMIEYQRHIVIKKGTYPKEKYNDYRAFRRSIAKFDKTKIVINTL